MKAIGLSKQLETMEERMEYIQKSSVFSLFGGISFSTMITFQNIMFSVMYYTNFTDLDGNLAYIFTTASRIIFDQMSEYLGLVKGMYFIYHDTNIEGLIRKSSNYLFVGSLTDNLFHFLTSHEMSLSNEHLDFDCDRASPIQERKRK